MIPYTTAKTDFSSPQETWRVPEGDWLALTNSNVTVTDK